MKISTSVEELLSFFGGQSKGLANICQCPVCPVSIHYSGIFGEQLSQMTYDH